MTAQLQATVSWLVSQS